MTSDELSSDPVRRALLKAIEQAPQKTNLKQLSLDLGYNHAYLHQFIHRGSPRVLPEHTRHALAKLLNIPDRILRHASALSKPNARAIPLSPEPNFIEIGYLDHHSQHRFADQSWGVPSSFFSHIADVQAIKLIALEERDHVSNVFMINTNDRSPLQAGEFALDMKRSIRIRHIEQISPEEDRLHITGVDGHDYASALSQQSILGRVIFKGALFIGTEGVMT